MLQNATNALSGGVKDLYITNQEKIYKTIKDRHICEKHYNEEHLKKCSHHKRKYEALKLKTTLTEDEKAQLADLSDLDKNTLRYDIIQTKLGYKRWKPKVTAV